MIHVFIIQLVFSGYVSHDNFSCFYYIRYLTIINCNVRTCFYGYSMLVVAVRYVHGEEIGTANVMVTLVFYLVRYISCCTFDNIRHVPFPFIVQRYT